LDLITNIYVDGFNLYYRALKGTRLKWLNPLELCRLSLRPNHVFKRLRYFTAEVKARPSDPTQPMRQRVYLRAIRTLPNTSIHLGYFLTHDVSMPLANTNPPQYVRVTKTEEKGSDVNLATHLLHDAHRGEYQAAVVVSNDSDLVEPIRIVRQELGLKVLVLNPARGTPSVELKRAATLFKDIRRHVLARSQFPEPMTDAHGSFRKPSTW
jgi:uncharacterized LabA/DUF88 family protein